MIIKTKTLSEIREKYGVVARIETKTGSTYVGAFNQKGANMFIQTTTGEVKLPVSIIVRIAPI